MLKFYYHPLSPIARRVWLALLEKEIPFEAVLVDLKNGEQRQPEFLEINPFHHVPAIIDGSFRLIESLAILDYLENKYPTPSLLPKSTEELATMRMIQMVTANELVPKIPKLIDIQNTPLSKDIAEHLDISLKFLNDQLGEKNYFGGEVLNLADIVVGATIPLFSRLGVEIEYYPALNDWCNRITSREAWRTTNPNDTDFNNWKSYIQRWIQLMSKRRQRQVAGNI
ncbi:MAG: glutathione S-transferase family protein [Nostocaceae cyanobacterium]|nr:glutathione S-transferase family protein [Nostocaceae cyanobacterium]